jgi:hypothetical protein
MPPVVIEKCRTPSGVPHLYAADTFCRLVEIRPVWITQPRARADG